jgi:hypothetical protein
MVVLYITLQTVTLLSAVIDFGGTVSATAGDLTIEFPTADASNAIVRIA